MNDIFIRAVKTFVQAALAYSAAGVYGITDGDAVKTLIIGALAAGLSAVWNLLVTQFGSVQ